MKTIFIILVQFALVVMLYAQAESDHISFTYNANGNRVLRKLITLTGSRLANLSEVPDTAGTADISGPQPLQKEQPPLFDKLVSHEITIFPNPTQGKIKVNIANLKPEEKSFITVYDISGKTYYESHYSAASAEIDLSEKPAGNYFMKIDISGSTTVWKIIKQ